MADAGLGLGPWEMFHQGIGRHASLELGTVSILVGIPILVLWWPLGERPGIGTLLNVALIARIRRSTTSQSTRRSPPGSRSS
jgi:uncharacterized membrane protein YczE